MTIDWSRPIEVVKPSGTVAAWVVTEPGPGVFAVIQVVGWAITAQASVDGRIINSSWTVRNVGARSDTAAPEHPTPTQYAPELVDSDQRNVEADMIGMLSRDHARMRSAGTKLAEAALYVVREHDGLRRLALAVSEWAVAVANEGDHAGVVVGDKA